VRDLVAHCARDALLLRNVHVTRVEAERVRVANDESLNMELVIPRPGLGWRQRTQFSIAYELMSA
jgi:hypothetical protein